MKLSDWSATDYPPVARNVSFLNSTDESQIRSCLLLGFRQDKADFSPLHISYNHSAREQLLFLFNQIEPRAQETFKTAIVQAIKEWREDSHGVYTLQELSYLVADVRAAEAIDYLRVLFDYGRLETLSSKDREETTAIILSVLAGFIPDASAEVLFKQLFWNNKFAPFAAQLFLGLCTGKPTDYPKYVPRFLDLAKKHPKYYLVPAVMSLFVKSITLTIICEHFMELSKLYWEPFIAVLSYGESAPLTCHDFNGRILLESRVFDNSPAFPLPSEVSEYLNYKETSTSNSFHHQALEHDILMISNMISEGNRACDLVVPRVEEFLKDSINPKETLTGV